MTHFFKRSPETPRSTHSRRSSRLVRTVAMMVSLMLVLPLLTSCFFFRKNEGGHNGIFGSGNDLLRIVSGSENRVLEPLIEEYANRNKLRIQMDYKGSLDIMRLLESSTIPYDAVWPAASLWISVGDKQHRVKHLTSTSMTPVVFGIRKPLAEQLGLVDKEHVKVSDLLTLIEQDKLKFTMTSATQSNSGASA